MPELTNHKEKEMFMSLKDWRQAIRTPPAYRVGNSVVRMQGHFFTCLITVGIFVLLLFYNLSGKTRSVSYGFRDLDKENGFYSNFRVESSNYNSTYPLSRPESVHDKVRYRIAVVSDLDHASRSKTESNIWISFYKKGYLMWNPILQTASISWDVEAPKKLQSSFSSSGRGMELSELVTFDGRLLTIDDRSGIIYGIENDSVYVWILLTDGPGKTNKGFKAEWATVKDECLYVGGMGKEWTTARGEFVNYYPMWVKKINQDGRVFHLDWTENYKLLRRSMGIDFPGYLLHESCVWSTIHKRWFFLPRRMSHQSYDEEKDETAGTNILLSASENFTDIKVTEVGEVLATHGFSSFKFIPGTKDEVIIALKTVEHLGNTETYLMIFTINGKIILGETKIANVKYEGFEFI